MKGYDWVFALIVGGVAAATSGCSIVGSDHTGVWDDGYISIAGDARGMRAFGDAMNGLITNGKATPDADTPFYANRRLEDQEITKRRLIETNPAPQGLWQRMWGQPVNNGQEAAPK